MEKRIRWLGLIFIGCFALLFVQLNNWQIRQASTITHDVTPPPAHPVDEFIQPRGMILTSDYKVIARSEKVNNHWVRVYPEGPLFADVTGYFDVTAHAAPLGLEAEYDNYLRVHQTPVHTASGLFPTHQETNDLVTTLSARLQAVAQQALGGQEGAVVALDPSTGAVLAMYGNPTYDPNGFSTYDAAQAKAFYKSLDPSSGSSPLVDAPTDDLHPPGSTFKIIDTAAIFDHDPALASNVWKPVSDITFPNAPSLSNFGGEVCGGSRPQILTASCDTSYGLVGISLGADVVVQEAQAFGFDSVPPIDLPQDVAASQIPAPDVISFPRNLASSSIGQFDDDASALQMALVSAGIANGGEIMAPHLLNYALNQQGQVVDSYQAHAWRTATSPGTAATVRQLMLGPTNNANNTTGGTLADILCQSCLDGLVVAGKTGTAQTETACGGYDWVTAFGPAGPGQTPTVAVAAWVQPAAAEGCDGTGATVAGPVVRAMLLAALG